MNLKIFNKKFLLRAVSGFMGVLFALLAFVNPLPAFSAEESLEDLKDEYAQLEKDVASDEKKLKQVQSDISDNKEKLKTINSEIDAIESQVEILNERIDLLDGSISELKPQITELNGQIAEVEENIEAIDAEIAEAQALAEETQDQLLERIREDYMSGGNTSVVEVLLTSEDLSSFLARMELMDRVSENDEELIEEMEKRADELNDLKEEANVQKADLQIKKGLLDTKMSELNSNQSDLQSSKNAASSKQQALNSKYAEVNGIINELGEESEEYQEQIAKERADMEKLSNQIDNYIEENGSAKGEEVPEEYIVNRTSSNLIWPVPYNNTAVTCHFGYYSNGSPHYGTDIVVRDASGNNISNGKNVVAAQSGTVILAVNDGGYNSGYGNYCIIDHGDGMMTLYCHCKTILVSKGQVVSQGQTIAQIGLTGNTTGYHLHFEVRIKGADGSVTRVNAENYVSCPG